MQLGGGTLSDLESNFMVVSGTSVFLQTGQGCLGTLNCPSLMAQKWGTYLFKDVWPFFPSRTGAICTREVLVIYQEGYQPRRHRGWDMYSQSWHLLLPGVEGLGMGVGVP